MSATYIHTKRKAGYSKLILRLLAFLYIASLAAAIAYLWLFTQDRFISSAEFKISRQDSSTGMEAGLMQLALPGLSDSGSQDSKIAIGYIDSADLLLELEKDEKFKLVEHYSSPAKDFIFRMDPSSNLEERLEYYRKRITAHFDTESGMTVITVDTFSPALSQKIAASLLKKTEVFVNVINQNIAEQQLAFVRSEVERTAKRVEEINEELLTLQNQHNFISPDEVIAANLKAVEEMRMELLKSEAELSTILRDSPNSPRIDSMRSRIRSLNELIDIESAKLTGPEKDRLSQLLMKFKQLQLRLETAVRLRTGAEMMLEKNRVEAVATSRFFSVIQNPFLPEDVGFPRRPYATTAILGLGFLLYLILRALGRSILERPN
jgi:capsular polysaccharide transport system permease protein